MLRAINADQIRIELNRVIRGEGKHARNYFELLRQNILTDGKFMLRVTDEWRDKILKGSKIEKGGCPRLESCNRILTLPPRVENVGLEPVEEIKFDGVPFLHTPAAEGRCKAQQIADHDNLWVNHQYVRAIRKLAGTSKLIYRYSERDGLYLTRADNTVIGVIMPMKEEK